MVDWLATSVFLDTIVDEEDGIFSKCFWKLLVKISNFKIEAKIIHVSQAQ